MHQILKGKRVQLQALMDEDLETMLSWYSNSSFLRRLDALPAKPTTLDSLKKWRDDASERDNHFLFSIRDDKTFVGYIELDGILWTQRNGWVAIAIGDSSLQGKGYGTEAMSLLLDYAFYEINLHRIQLTVFSYNQPAIWLYEHLGFTYEGAQREFILRDDEAYDMYIYGMLRREWIEKRTTLSKS